MSEENQQAVLVDNENLSNWHRTLSGDNLITWHRILSGRYGLIITQTRGKHAQNIGILKT